MSCFCDFCAQKLQKHGKHIGNGRQSVKKERKTDIFADCGAITGKIPCIHFCEDVGSSLSALDEILDGLKRDGIDDIVIHGTR